MNVLLWKVPLMLYITDTVHISQLSHGDKKSHSPALDHRL